MIKILDKYIILKYVKTFFFTALIISLIGTVIDLSQNVHRYLKHDNLTFWIVTRDYYLNFIPWLNATLWSLFGLIAVIFFTSRLAKNSEIISILNAGVSFRRILVPYLLAASGFFLLHLIANHFILPKGTKVLREFENTYMYPGNDKTQTADIHFFISDTSKVYIRHYNRRDTSATNFRLEHFKDGKLQSVLQSRSIKFKKEPGIWTVRNYRIRTFEKDKENLIVANNQPMDTLLNILPKDFIKFSNQKDMMTTSELKDYIATEKKRGMGATKKYEAEVHRRTSEPFTIMILTIIGVAIASRKVRGGIGLHLAIGITLGALYIVLSKFALTFALGKSLPVLLGMWIPNIVFALVAIFLILKAQK